MNLRGVGLRSALAFCVMAVGACVGPAASPSSRPATQLTKTGIALESQPAHDMYVNLQIDQVVPAGGSVDVPLAFEGSTLALVTGSTSSPGISVAYAGAALPSYSANGATAFSKSVEDPIDGPLHITNTGATQATVTVIVQVDTSRYLTITPSANTVAKGAGLSFDVTLSEATSADEASAYLADPNGMKTPITLTKLGTGHWSGQVSPTVGGANSIYVQTSGGPLRFESSEISVITGDVTFAPGFTERLIDTDHDGLANTLELTVTVTTNKAARYDIVAHLVDSAGKAIDVAPGDVSLVAGTNQVPIAFDGSTIYKSGLSGPYRLVNVTLGDSSVMPAVTVAAANDLGATQAYNYQVFQH
jgi:hypothetical protein